MTKKTLQPACVSAAKVDWTTLQTVCDGHGTWELFPDSKEIKITYSLRDPPPSKLPKRHQDNNGLSVVYLINCYRQTTSFVCGLVTILFDHSES